LITNIRVIKIGEQEAITLSNDLLENTSFLLQIFNNIDRNFMAADLKIEKTDGKTAMDSSVVNQPKAEEQKESRKKGRDNDLFFTLNERDVKSNQSGGVKKETNEFRERHS
jgi:hypothetical protein